MGTTFRLELSLSPFGCFLAAHQSYEVLSHTPFLLGNPTGSSPVGFDPGILMANGYLRIWKWSWHCAKGFSWKSWGFWLAQNLQFCLFTYPHKWKWASGMIRWSAKSSFLLSNQSQNVILWILSWRNSCKICSLCGYKFVFVFLFFFSKFYE